jgi:hypothetical protein
MEVRKALGIGGHDLVVIEGDGGAPSSSKKDKLVVK